MSTELPPIDNCWAGSWDDAEMRAYGQKCRNAALLEAAELLERFSFEPISYIADKLRAKIK